jgi:hypothetical protein
LRGWAANGLAVLWSHSADPAGRVGESRGESRGLAPKSLAGAATAMFDAGKRPVTYHGYYFHRLKAQGPDAPGGAMDYLVNGKMIGGFALIAYPAEYGVSGIKAMLVGHQGVVYEKDLGAATEALAW